MKFLNITLLLFLLAGCASKPVLYPNKKLKAVGKEASKKDIDMCMAEADAYLESAEAKKILRGAGKGSIFGGAVGAVTGLLTGNVVRGATSGAAIGATAGGVGAAISPDQLERAYVNQCLEKKGYQVLGWD
jgi:uncharacterized membrane protein